MTDLARALPEEKSIPCVRDEMVGRIREVGNAGYREHLAASIGHVI